MLLGIIQLRNEISGGASHDSNERYPPPKCHPATRTAVLDLILRRIKSSTEECSILWLYGPAGAGKSAIAQTIAERTGGEQLAASFFFSRGKPDRDTAQKLWATIAFQIAMSMPALRDLIGSAVVDTPGIFFKSPENQLHKLVIEPLHSLGSEISDSDISQSSPFLIIIDGLDECKREAEQSEILHSIAMIIHSYHLPLCFLIASRPEPHILHSFDSSDLRNICYHICLDGSFKPVEDVHLFLRCKFDEIYEKHWHMMASIPQPWPPEDVVQLLARRSSGQFIYATTVIRFIDDEDYRPTDRLEIALNASQHSTAFKNSELDLLYQQILSTCPNTSLLCRILGCILVSQHEQLSAVDIEALLSLCAGDVCLTFHRLHSLVCVPDSGEVIPYHASLEDFIFDPDWSGVFHISKQACHLDVARCCLRFAKQHSGRAWLEMLCVCCCHNPSLPNIVANL
jgi:hypothetical protein